MATQDLCAHPNNLALFSSQKIRREEKPHHSQHQKRPRAHRRRPPLQRHPKQRDGLERGGVVERREEVLGPAREEVVVRHRGGGVEAAEVGVERVVEGPGEAR